MTGKAYTDDDHRRMDEVVAQHLDKMKITWSSSPSTPELASVLQGVVNSDDRLNPSYRQLLAAVELLRNFSLLKSMLADAWKTGSYRDVRAFEFLQDRAPSEWSLLSAPRTIEGSKLNALREGLIAPYQGLAVDAFHAYLERNNQAFHKSGKRMYYGKFCTVVQSSGTGKTRLLLQLATKGVRVLYMNVRYPADTLSFPPRDETPADILSDDCDKKDRYRIRCYAFFAAVFKVLRTFMEMELDWYEDMCTIGSPVRAAFFEDLEREYVYIKHDIRTLSTGNTIMDKYYQEMVSSKGFPQASKNQPRVVIALDEAHTLHEELGMRSFSPVVQILETIQRYSMMNDNAVWVVFASTKANIGEPLSPGGLSHSARDPVEGQLLFTPFTQLGWDQNAPTLGDVRPDEVGKAGHIIQYGRPLWASLRGGYTLYNVEGLAWQKLCGKAVFGPDEHQAFAVLAQRFCLDIAFGHPGAISYVETLVENHLRVYTKITEDRIWSFSTYPSEPILSCAAASVLHEGYHLEKSMSSLENMVNKGVVDGGPIRELVSRFLWLLAKDFFVRTKVDAPSRNVMSPFEEVLRDCQLIPVVDFLDFVFGSKLWEAAPQGKGEFRNAYINFSHWVLMQFDFYRDDVEQVPIDTLMLLHWERTSAVQCSQEQPLVNQVIPMYFKPQKDGDRAGMSQIFISDQAHTSLDDIQRDDTTIAPGYRGLPYIAISVDVGAKKSAFDVRLDRSKDRDTCLRIYASSLNATTFAFLDGRDRLARDLQSFYASGSRPRRSDLCQDLEDQMQFGISRELRYMNVKERDEGE